MSPKPSAKKIKPPKGTRDLYPAELLRQRYIVNAWRDASIRCGFEEIAGPTFETTELYRVKSGEGILNELFQAFSGKSEREIEQVRATGQAEYALRPEFTPTLARMYAAKAKELPQPCKWFTAGSYFRAERPQRGRLREFLQWNVDAIGLPGEDDKARAQMDVEVIGCAAHLFEQLGIQSDSLSIMLNDRNAMAEFFASLGVADEQLESAFNLLDRQAKLPVETLRAQADDAGLSDAFIAFLTQIDTGAQPDMDAHDLARVCSASSAIKVDHWIKRDHTIARGLAYYTGTVFEAIAEGERAVAGGGRYDNLIELFGGPPTPACGFGMGDVVLGNLLEDKGLMPTGAQLMDAVARPQASIRPVAFVVPNGDDENEGHVHALVANLRRGIECDDWNSRDERNPWDADRYRVAPMHARVSYKSTRNLKKLRADAVNQHARFFVEIHADNKVELTDLDNREPITSDTHGSFSIDPSAKNYVGSAIAQRR